MIHDFLLLQLHPFIFLHFYFYLFHLHTCSLWIGLLSLPGTPSVGERDRERTESSSDLGQIPEKGRFEICNTFLQIEYDSIMIIYSILTM